MLRRSEPRRGPGRRNAYGEGTREGRVRRTRSRRRGTASRKSSIDRSPCTFRGIDRRRGKSRAQGPSRALSPPPPSASRGLLSCRKSWASKSPATHLLFRGHKSSTTIQRPAPVRWRYFHFTREYPVG